MKKATKTKMRNLIILLLIILFIFGGAVGALMSLFSSV